MKITLKVLGAAGLMLSAVVVMPRAAGANHEGLQRELQELRDDIRRDQDARDTDREIARLPARPGAGDGAGAGQAGAAR